MYDVMLYVYVDSKSLKLVFDSKSFKLVFKKILFFRLLVCCS